MLSEPLRCTGEREHQHATQDRWVVARRLRLPPSAAVRASQPPPAEMTAEQPITATALDKASAVALAHTRSGPSPALRSATRTATTRSRSPWPTAARSTCTWTALQRPQHKPEPGAPDDGSRDRAVQREPAGERTLGQLTRSPTHRRMLATAAYLPIGDPEPGPKTARPQRANASLLSARQQATRRRTGSGRLDRHFPGTGCGSRGYGHRRRARRPAAAATPPPQHSRQRAAYKHDQLERASRRGLAPPKGHDERHRATSPPVGAGWSSAGTSASPTAPRLGRRWPAASLAPGPACPRPRPGLRNSPKTGGRPAWMRSSRRQRDAANGHQVAHPQRQRAGSEHHRGGHRRAGSHRDRHRERSRHRPSTGSSDSRG